MLKLEPLAPAFVTDNRPSLEWDATYLLTRIYSCRGAEVPVPLLIGEDFIKFYQPPELAELGEHFASKHVSKTMNAFFDELTPEDPTIRRFYTRATAWLRACRYISGLIRVEDIPESQINITKEFLRPVVPKLMGVVVEDAVVADISAGRHLAR